MSKVIEIKIPDIGDFKDVPVIELLVAPGDTVEKETSLITLETDKASMEVPSPQPGVVQAINVKVGDKLSEGSVILTLAVTEQSTASGSETPKTNQIPPASSATPSQPSATPATRTTSPSPAPAADKHAYVVVLGAGPGG